MIQITLGQLPLWQFEHLAAIPTIGHYVSGRPGGVSEGELGALNLGLKAGDLPANVQENRRRVAEALGVDAAHLIFPSQTHSANVRLVHEDTNPEELADTDALVTNTPGLCISVMSADCVPILLFDPVAQAVGAVHAGWRGTVSRILIKTIEAMQHHFGTDPRNLLAGIGPSICAEVYEVGPEVIASVDEAFGNAPGLIRRRTEAGKGFLDLWEANRQQLLALGVPATSIEVAGICTYQQADQFFSARKSGNQAGRFAAGIMIRA